jgi:hypothetical protein
MRLLDLRQALVEHERGDASGRRHFRLEDVGLAWEQHALRAKIRAKMVGAAAAAASPAGSAREKSQPRNGAGETFMTAVAEIARETVSAAKGFAPVSSGGGGRGGGGGGGPCVAGAAGCTCNNGSCNAGLVCLNGSECIACGGESQQCCAGNAFKSHRFES